MRAAAAAASRRARAPPSRSSTASPTWSARTGLARRRPEPPALLALAEGDLEAATRRLEDAVDLYGLAAAPYERAQARLALARVLRELGAIDRALAEADAAHTAFEELDARRAAAEAAELLQALEPGNAARRPADES